MKAAQLNEELNLLDDLVDFIKIEKGRTVVVLEKGEDYSLINAKGRSVRIPNKILNFLC